VERVFPLHEFHGAVVPITKCLIFNPVAKKIITLFPRFSGAFNLKPYHPFAQKDFLRQLILREAKYTGQPIPILDTTSESMPALTTLFPARTKEVPETKSIHRTTTTMQRRWNVPVNNHFSLVHTA